MPKKKAAKIKVLHIITRLIIGGAQQNTILSVAGLGQKSEYEVSLLCGPETGSEGSLIELAASKFNLFIISQLRRNIHPYYDIVALFKIYRFIRNNHFDIIHTHSSKAGILGRLAARLAGRHIIVHTVHGWGHNDFQRPFIRRTYKTLEKISLWFTDKLIAVSNTNIKKGLADRIGKPGDYTLIRSGIELDRFLKPKISDKEMRDKFRVKQDVPIVGTVTRLCEQKAPLDFIRSAAIIAKNNPEVWFIIVGDGPLRSEVESLANKLGIDKRLILTGLRDDIPEIMSVFNVFLLCSLWEGLPRVLPQAMALGMPIVATDVDGNKEAIVNEENGLLVPAGDYNALAESVLKLLADPELANKMGQSSKPRVNEFCAAKMIDDIDKLYKKLISCGK